MHSTSGVTPNVCGREHLSRPADAGDDLVEDQQDVVAVADLAQDRQVLRRRVDDAAGVADRLDHDRRHGGRVFHLDHLLDDRGAGDAAIGIALAERAAITGRREDVQEAGRQRLVDRLARLQPRGRQAAERRAVPGLVSADDLVLARRLPVSL